MTRDEAFEVYLQACRDYDPMISERTARVYFDQYWGRREAARMEREENPWID